jgi:hypothetical protein
MHDSRFTFAIIQSTHSHKMKMLSNRSLSAFCPLGALSIDKAKPFFYNCTIANSLIGNGR